MTTGMLAALDVTKLQRLLRQREVSARDLAESSLRQVEATQGATNAFVALDGDRVMAQARVQDEAASQGRFGGALHGVPIAVKDNYLTRDFPTTACSRVHLELPMASDATVVALLRRAGAIIVGKTNMHEWAYGATNEVSRYGHTRNPWNTGHITGGSSGGSGAALAARAVPAALGSDTGGSVRIPSAACGVCGIKPTYGHASRNGVLPLSWSLDAPGPMARSARDLATLLAAMTGVDPDDPATESYRFSRDPQVAERPLRVVRLAVPHGEGFERSRDVAAAFDQAVAAMASEGAAIEETMIGRMVEGFAAWKVILHAEAAAYHAQFLERKGDLYSANVRLQLEAGRCLSAVDYLKAQQFRSLFNHELGALFERYDALLLPTLPVTAPRLGETQVDAGGKSLTPQDAMTYVAWMANMSGLPAVSIPCGFGRDGMPVGMMLVARAGSDYALLAIAAAFQTITDWHTRVPPTIN
jgi:aspartyl-tRNA(Asn)/glutamyl-tRNA(Gln) amidotransferase subunit A